MRVRTIIVRDKPVRIPDGWILYDRYLIEPKKGKPYILLMLSDGSKHTQKESCIGFDVTPQSEE